MAKRKKLRVALIFGGTSKERNVSMESAKNIGAILAKKYDLIPVEISREGKWLTQSKSISLIESGMRTKKVSNNRSIVPIDKNSKSGIDVAFLALHGPGGEDGTAQGLLEMLGIKYTCSKVLASALAMDKDKTKRLMASEGVNVAPHLILNREDYQKDKKKYLGKLRGKLVIKPNHIGSSVGITISADKKLIQRGIEEAFLEDDEIMVEPYLQGREFTVPVLGNKKLQALPVIEIVPKISEFFDYKAKYQTGGSDEIVPARISKDLSQKLQNIALLVHKVIGCRGITRSDFIVTNDGKIYFLEINPIPGMTQNSLVPKAVKAAGMTMTQFTDRLIQLALDKE